MTAGSAFARPRPWVKICGVTRPEDAELAASFGVAFVGVNFWRRSTRQVEIGPAREIAGALAGSPVELVGVFVNEEPARIDEIAEAVGLDRIQLHGDESDEIVARFGPRALRGLRAEGRVAALIEELSSSVVEPTDGAPAAFDAALERSGLSLQWKASAVVLDSPRAEERYGGTGESWNWGWSRALCAGSPVPILVAGGIGPDNAIAALGASGAAGVDVASGVESAPGVKDREKMERLFEEVERVRRDR